MKLKSLISEATQYKIYCDMDGVLTDFSGDFMKLAKQLGKLIYLDVDDVPNNAGLRGTKSNTEVKHFGVSLNKVD